METVEPSRGLRILRDACLEKDLVFLDLWSRTYPEELTFKIQRINL